MPGNPTLVLFDVNETLSDLAPLRTRLAELGAPEHMLDIWFASTLRDGIALAAAGAYADFRTVALDVLRGCLIQVEGLRDDPARAAESLLAAFGELDVHPDVRAGVLRLAKAGVRLATLTNGATAIAAALLERAGVADRFERLMSADEVRRWKPAPEPYLYAARQMGVAPENCTLIAVHPWDIDGAKRAGLRAGWVNRRGQRYPTFFQPPDIAAETLDSLADRVQSP